MSLVFDGVIILIFIVTALIGFYKGFVRYVISMLGTLAAVIIALAAANFLAQPVYDRFIKDELRNSIQAETENIDVVEMVCSQLERAGLTGGINEDDIRAVLQKGGDIAGNMKAYLSEKYESSQAAEIADKFDSYLHTDMADKLNSYGMPESFIAEKIKITGKTIDGAISALASENKAEGAAYLEKNIFSPPLIGVLKVILFAVCFIIVTLLIKLIILISGVLKKLPALSAANRFGGLLLGLCKGALYVALAAFLYCTVVNSTENSLEIINSENAERSYLFKYFFNFFYK